MKELIKKPRRTAAEELSDLAYEGEEYRFNKRVPFRIGKKQFAAEFVDTIHSLTVGFWEYHHSAYPDDSPEETIGAIKFRKDNDAIHVKYDSLENMDDTELTYFAEGLSPDRLAEPEDLERFQPLMQAALQTIKHD